MYWPAHQVHTPLRSSDEQNLSDNDPNLARCSQHIHDPFSVNCNAQDTAIHRIPQIPLRQELYEPPTIQETIEAIAHL